MHFTATTMNTNSWNDAFTMTRCTADKFRSGGDTTKHSTASPPRGPRQQGGIFVIESGSRFIRPVGHPDETCTNAKDQNPLKLDYLQNPQGRDISSPGQRALLT